MKIYLAIRAAFAKRAQRPPSDESEIRWVGGWGAGWRANVRAVQGKGVGVMPETRSVGDVSRTGSEHLKQAAVKAT